MDESESIRRGFETSDASPRGILLAGVFVLLGIGCALAVSAWLYLAWEGEPKPAASIGPEGSFTAGVEQQTEIERSWEALERDLRARRRSEAADGMSIERAIDLVVEESQQKRPSGK